VRNLHLAASRFFRRRILVGGALLIGAADQR